MPELYDNQFLRDLSSNYTAGSGTLSVSAAAPASVQSGTFRVRLANTQNTLLKVTAGSSTTTWTVVAEANDANCMAAPNAVLGGEITAGMLNQLRSDQAATGAYASRSAYKAGTLYLADDGYSLGRDTGAAFADWGPLFPITLPPAYSSWTWVNQGTATGGNAGGSVYVNAPAVGGTNWRVLIRAAPGSTPWTAVLAFSALFHQAGNTRSGLVVYNNSSTKMVTFGPSCDGARSVDQWSSPTAFAGGGSAFTPCYEMRCPLIFYQVVNDGTNLTFSLSPDNANWIQINQQTLASFIGSVTHIGFGMDSEGNSYNGIVSLFHCSGF